MKRDNFHIASDPSLNIWVSASAGSGKTKLLVDRVLRLLLSGVDPQQILCLTFTKAAASEMYERIKTVLKNWFLLNEESLSTQLKLLQIEPSKPNILRAKNLIFQLIDKEQTIKISTIHSLCQEILMQFPLESGLGFSTRIIDENEKQNFIKKAKYLFLKDGLENNEFLDILCENATEYNFSKYIETLLTFDNHSFEWSNLEKNYPEFIKKINDFYKVDLANNLNSQIYEIKNKILKLISSYQNYVEEIAILKELHSLQDALTNENEYSKLSQILETVKTYFFTNTNAPRVKLLLKAEKQLASGLEKELFSIQQELEVFFENKNSLLLAALSNALCELKKIFTSNYEELKKNESAIDFNDIIIKTFALFNNNEIKDWVRYKLGYNLKHVLIDESQDTNLAQWKIIFALTEEFFSQNNTSFFVVGDEKQSIYSFQGASPTIYEAIEKIYQQKLKSNLKSFQKVGLNHSYRSGQLILNFIDRVFDGVNHDFNCPITQNYHPHNSKIKSIANKVEIFPVITTPVKKTSTDYKWQFPTDNPPLYNAAKKSATIIAVKVHQLLQEGFFPQDIMILVRKRDDFTKYILSEIKKLNIPITGLDKILLKENIAIQDLIAFGEFLLYPYDDLNLAALLKSPIFGLSEKELLDLCAYRQNTLWEEIQNSSESKLLEIKNLLGFYLNSRIYNNLYEIYFDLLINRGIKTNFIQRLGEEIEEIIDEFLNICQKYQNEHYASLELFIDWFKKTDIEVKRDFASDQQKIRLLTIHGAKGLQAKIVILADTVSTPSTNENLFWDDINNIPLFNGHSLNQTKSYLHKKEYYKSKITNEYFRLLYVALTRAESYLIIFGHTNSSKIPGDCWYKYISKAAELEAEKINLSHLFGFNISDNQEENSICVLSPVKYEISTPYLSTSIKKENEHLPQVPSKKLIINHKKDFPIEASDQEFEKSNFINIQKGKLIHKLLEALIDTTPCTDQNTKHQIITKLSKFYNLTLAPGELLNFEKFYQQIQSLINPKMIIKKEQGFVCNHDGNYKKGIIDLMLIEPKEIILIDYKNAKFNEENINLYTEQLLFYKTAIRNIYPDHLIKCYIGWVRELKLTLIN